MNTDIIHTTSFMNQRFASDAHIFSERQVSRDVITNLLYAQLVVESKWLGQYPMLALCASPEIEAQVSLFEDVGLITPDNWSAIDRVGAFLMNRRM